MENNLSLKKTRRRFWIMSRLENTNWGAPVQMLQEILVLVKAEDRMKSQVLVEGEQGTNHFPCTFIDGSYAFEVWEEFDAL